MCNIKNSEDNILPEEEEDDSETSYSENSSTSIDEYCEEDDEYDDLDADNAGRNSATDPEEDEGEGREVTDYLSETIKRIREAERTHPPCIESGDLVVDLSFHPKTNFLAAALLNGDITIYKYDLDSVTVIKTIEVHTRACRAVEYSSDGQLLYSISKDRSIMITDCDTGKLKEFYEKAHESALYSLLIVSEHLFATGDEDGVVKLWDMRRRAPLFTMDKLRDYVSSMVTSESKRYLACTSGEGVVATINMPARKFHAESEQYGAELTCAGLYKEGEKLICGTSNGKMVIYNWGQFGLHVDAFPGPVKKGISCQVAVNDNIIVTGWEDGQIRATHLFPNKHLGVVGQHRLSVDAIDISHDGEYLASCSLDHKINFWPINFFNDLDLSNIEVTSETNLPSSQFTDRKDFFSDLVE